LFVETGNSFSLIGVMETIEEYGSARDSAAARLAQIEARNVHQAKRHGALRRIA
jgi:hypothetical protein